MYIILLRMLLNAQGSQSNPILTNPKTCRTPEEMPYNTLLSIHPMTMKYEDEDAEYAARTEFYRPPTKQLIKPPFAMHI